MDFTEILQKAVELESSDIHVVVGLPPMVRVSGVIKPMGGLEVLDAQTSQRLIYSILNDSQKKRFEEEWELDCSFMIRNIARFRINVFKQINGIEAVLRVIPSVIPTPESIGLTPAIVNCADLNSGLVLVTGPTGSGKTTTLACLIDIINQRETMNIITVEDPVEYVYENKKSIIRQREVGQQTKSFAIALRQALREDPDVILVGELRDLETISCAISAAETGHLVFGTLHTADAPQTVDRIIDVFPPYQQQQVRTQLSTSLKAVISQTLVPRIDGGGRVAAREIMIVTTAIANLIREGKVHMVYGAIDTGAKFGMVNMDRALGDLVRRGVIDMREAMARAHNPEMMKGTGAAAGRTAQ